MSERIQETVERLIPTGQGAAPGVAPPAAMQQHAAKGAAEPSGSSEKSGFILGCPFGRAPATGGSNV
jgi:hypothetical protein